MDDPPKKIKGTPITLTDKPLDAPVPDQIPRPIPERYVVYWRINEKEGHGDPMSENEARNLAREGRLKHGKETHWIRIYNNDQSN